MKKTSPMEKFFSLILLTLALTFWIGTAPANADDQQETSKAPSPCQDPQKGKVIQRQLALPALVVDSFLRPDRRAPDFSWIFPTDWCVGPGSKIDFIDENKFPVGSLEVKSVETTEFTFLNLEQGPKNSIAYSHFQWLQSQQPLPIKAVDLFLRLVYDHHTFGSSAFVTIGKGHFKPNPNYLLLWHPRLLPDRSFAAQPLNHEKLIEMIEGKKLTIYDLGANGFDRSTWRLPGTKPGKLVFGDLPRWEILDFDKLLNALNAVQAAILLEEKSSPVLVYSEDDNSINAHNAATVLRALGHKEIYWSPNLVLDWFGGKTFADREVGLARFISSEELKQKLGQKNLRLFDIRPDPDYFAGTIPGARQLAGSSVTGEEYLAHKRKYFPGRDYPGIRDIQPGQSYFMADSKVFEDMNSPIVLFGFGGTSELKVFLVHRSLRRAGIKELYIYKGGFVEWYSKAKWLNPSEGYQIETPRPATHRLSPNTGK